MEVITIPKLNEYEKFGGDGDWFSRLSIPTSSILNSDKEWHLIEGLIQDIKLVKGGLVSDEYAEKLKGQLVKYCDNAAGRYS